MYLKSGLVVKPNVIKHYYSFLIMKTYIELYLIFFKKNVPSCFLCSIENIKKNLLDKYYHQLIEELFWIFGVYRLYYYILLYLQKKITIFEKFLDKTIFFIVLQMII